MHGSYLWIHDAQGLMEKVQQSINHLYKKNLKDEENACFLGEQGDSAWLWHKQVGNVNFTSVKQTQNL